jgi:hypothetical protein
MNKRRGIEHVAPATPENVVNFVQRQTFSRADKIEPLAPRTPRRGLQRVLCDFLDSEINAGLQAFAFDSFRVWIGDELNGIHSQAELKPNDTAWGDDAAIAHWLHETALKLYPQSEYAKRYQ